MEKFRILFNLISKTQNYNFFFFIFFTIIGMFFETFTIGLIIPVISQILNPNLIYNYPIILNFFELISPINLIENIFNFKINISSEHEIIITSVFLFFLFFCIKFLYMVFLEWVKSLYIYGIYNNIGNKLLYLYIHQPIIFHISKSSSKLITNITTEVTKFIENAVDPFIRLVAETFFVTGIILLLLIYQPLATIISVSIVVLFSLIFINITKKYVKNWSKKRQKSETLRIKTFQESLGGIGDIKLRNLENFFLNNFKKENKIVSSIFTKQRWVSELPFYFLELLAVLGLVLIVIVVIFQLGHINNVIMSLALFTGAAFKLIPSTNRILHAYSYIKFAEPIFRLFDYELKELIPEIVEKNKPVLLDFNHSINFMDINYKYPKSKKFILKNLNLKILPKSSVGISGQSGVGKSTLVKLLIGFFMPSKGSISVGNNNIFENLINWRKSIGYVPQSTFLIDDSILKNIAFGIDEKKINYEKVHDILKICQLEQFVENLPKKLNSLVGEVGVKISGGEKQRIGIARALYNDPKILVLDEATSSLDSDTENKILECFKKLKGKITIISIAHKESSLSFCDYKYVLSSKGDLEKIN